MSVPNPATTDWVPMYAGGTGLAYKQDWSGAATYQDGDVVVKDGIAYLCVGGPTTIAPDIAPWGGASPNRPAQELAYAEVTTAVTSPIAAASAAATVLTLPPVTLDGGTPILIEFYCPQVVTGASASAQTVITLWDGSTDLGMMGMSVSGVASAAGLPLRYGRRLIPSAGTHTFSIRTFAGTAAGTLQCGAGGVGLFVPIWARITQANPALIIPTVVTPTTYGTTLPASPADGQEAVLVDSITAPTYQWRFRYNAGSSSPYKWEYIGGNALHATGAGGTVTSTSFTDFPTANLSVTTPRSGVYLFALGGGLYGATGASAYMGVKRGAATLLDTECISQQNIAGSNLVLSLALSVGPFTIAAGDVLKFQGRATSGNCNSQSQWLDLIPVRVA